MLAYHVVYADRAIGGLCEYYEVGEKDGVRTVNVIGVQFRQSDLIVATTGRWAFYASGVVVCVVDLDTPPKPAVRPDLLKGNREDWVV